MPHRDDPAMIPTMTPATAPAANEVPALRLSPPPFAGDVALSRIWDALPLARVVGGAVRDALLGLPVADIDLATPLAPEAAAEALRAAGIKVVPTGLAHGTVTAVVDRRGFEITALRRDVETDGRHAVVLFTEDWRADAMRRDFTINALSLDRDGGVYDYAGGLGDLKAGLVRFVGDPATRIREDYLRILRFFRFQSRYGRSPPDAATREALRAGIPGLARLSVERVWMELRRILSAADPVDGVALMAELGVLPAVAPELSAAPLAALRDAGAPADPILRVAAMLDADPAGFAERLKLSNDDRDRLLRLRATPAPKPADDDAALRRLLADYRRDDLIDRSWIAGAPERLRQRLVALPQPVFPLMGKDVLALGKAPGPAVGRLLYAVRAWWLAGGAVADRSACLAELARQACVPSPSAQDGS
ncbi:CCA tRNA nucleotidyltransferase [Rhodopila sp.]|jgi:poly(A) polymerase/tRNA nucleotidyltransferase (CCA-adding enzyme)|uniref:CCA tRNA nucleotidyltransferase n=1 Tax=Rhodopila sp. TaxID=2480087 RepID=UPI002BCE9263|nr:CCA tRNA nucleotidyltransferase [Rhodopila sp.]HVZ08568.1 CCA tRNA nucleotidyltransferase [Rhodopila sp.]